MVRSWQFHITAGVLCLDFANTLSWRRSPKPIERLETIADLASWARQVRLISPSEESRIRKDGVADPRRAAAVLTKARALREAIFAVFAAISDQIEPREGDRLALQRSIKQAIAASRLGDSGGSYRWRTDQKGLAGVLDRVALSAEALLRSEDVHRIGQCSGRDCRWLWVDRTRNQSRRWCDMAVCGNRAKADRYHRRHVDKFDRQLS